MLDPGLFKERVIFESRIEGIDGYGNTLTDEWGQPLNVWQPINVWSLPNVWNEGASPVWAHFRPQFGREVLAAGRMESTMQGVLTTRSFDAVRLVDPAFRARFISGPYRDKIFQIRSIIPTNDRRYIEMAVEEGVAT